MSGSLIHMNGRVYDYNLGRFMSVDPFIQSPTSTQSVNPYSYIMNNPLAGTDPTGYCSTDDSVAGCSDSLGEGESSDITEGGKVVGTVGKDSQGNMYITKSNGNAGHQAIQGAMGKAGDVSKVGSLEQNSAKERDNSSRETAKGYQGEVGNSDSNSADNDLIKDREEIVSSTGSWAIEQIKQQGKSSDYEGIENIRFEYHHVERETVNGDLLAAEAFTEDGLIVFYKTAFDNLQHASKSEAGYITKFIMAHEFGHFHKSSRQELKTYLDVMRKMGKSGRLPYQRMAPHESKADHVAYDLLDKSGKERRYVRGASSCDIGSCY